MYNPKDVFTAEQLEEHKAHLFNMKQAIFWLRNEADDLHMHCSCDPDDPLRAIYDMDKLLDSKLLENGDGEVEDND
tara:strand:- start:792 stop:1019 length:228 start_codon:yes stop_codon:yes gene_type:complete